MKFFSTFVITFAATGILALPAPGADMIEGIDSISTRSQWSSKGAAATDETAAAEAAPVEKRQCQRGEDSVDCISTRSQWKRAEPVQKRQCERGEDSVDCISTRSQWKRSEPVQKRQCKRGENSVDCISTRSKWSA